MEEPIENLYFNWLCAKVQPTSGPGYIDLFKILHQTPFVWFIPGDGNRADDGCELRVYFLRETHIQRDSGWLSQPCSIFEMLIAFAQRASFQTGLPDTDWFWELLINLGLNEYNRVTRSQRSVINDILNKFVWRTYSFDGRGGLFPLRSPTHDQRQVEIWYQFSEYLVDRGLV